MACSTLLTVSAFFVNSKKKTKRKYRSCRITQKLARGSKQTVLLDEHDTNPTRRSSRFDSHHLQVQSSSCSSEASSSLSTCRLLLPPLSPCFKPCSRLYCPASISPNAIRTAGRVCPWWPPVCPAAAHQTAQRQLEAFDKQANVGHCSTLLLKSQVSFRSPVSCT